MATLRAISATETLALRRGLEKLRFAQRVVEALHWAVSGLIAGLALCAAGLVAGRFLAISPDEALIAIPLLTMLAMMVAFSWRRSLAKVALLADRRLGLQERLITAWELKDQQPTPLTQAQVQDTVQRLTMVRRFQAFPLDVGLRQVLTVGALAVLVVGLVALPNPRLRDAQQRQMEEQVLAHQAQVVGQLAYQIATAAGETPTSEQQATIRALKTLQRALQAGDWAKAQQALVAAQDQLQTQSSAQAQREQAALDQAAAILAANQGTGSVTRALAEAVGSGNFNRAAQQLSRLAQQVPSMTQSQRDALQSTLRDAGAAAAKNDPALGMALQQAAASMGTARNPGNSQAMQQAFQRAASSLQQAGQAVQSENQLQQAIAQVQASANALQSQQQLGQGTGQQRAPAANAQAREVMSLPGIPGAANGKGTGQQGNGQSTLAGSGQSPPNTSGNQAALGSGTGNGKGSGAQGDRVYAPSMANGPVEQVPNATQGDGTQVTANGREQPPLTNGKLVPYTRVIAQYQRQAVQAMDQSHVPMEEQNLVRNYFSALAAGQ